MREITGGYLAAAAMAVLLGWGGSVVHDTAAQKIVCWKDKSGKTIGCGDKVPPEYQDNAASELSKAGVKKKSIESAEDEAMRKSKERENEKLKAEQDKKAAEQKRQDSALINTYSDEKEIDLRRDRDLATTDTQITQLKVMLKNVSDRHTEVKGRFDKAGKGSDVLKEEFTRAEADKRKAEQNLAEKEKEKEDITKRYAAQKARFIELRGGSAPAPAAAAKK